MIVQDTRNIILEQVELASPGEGEVLVGTRLVGICGSDVHAAAGKHPFISLPYSPGHEVVGVIEAVGPGVSGMQVGDRVIVEPNMVCGACRFCLDGRYNLCEHLRVFGCQLPGAMADGFVIRSDRLHSVPPRVTDLEAVLVEPLGTALHALRLVGDVSERSVVVLGAGTIGLLAAIAAREAGARRVIATDLLAQKRERALELGADDAVPADAPEAVPRIREILGGSADVVLDCVSSQQSIRDAISLAQNGGTVMCIGVATGLVEIPLHLVQDREIELHGSAMYTGEDIRAAIDLIEHGAFPADRIVTAVLPLEKAAEAFALAASGEEIKVAIRPTASP